MTQSNNNPWGDSRVPPDASRIPADAWQTDEHGRKYILVKQQPVPGDISFVWWWIGGALLGPPVIWIFWALFLQIFVIHWPK